MPLQTHRAYLSKKKKLTELENNQKAKQDHKTESVTPPP